MNMNNKILPKLENKNYIASLQVDYDIMFCPIEEVDKLVEFINAHWRKNHIFVISRELLNWQHLDKKNNRYNFVIARHKQTKQIHSVLGFVPTSQFDSELKKTQIWPCIWKVREDIKVKGLGVSLYHFLVNQLTVETISILGISETALSIYKSWNFKTGRIVHYFMLNDAVKEYKLIDNYSSFESYSSGCNNVSDCSFNICSLENFISIKNDIFRHGSKYKSKSYYINRFYKHPIYSYIAYAIMKGNEIKAVFFLRECIVGDRKALRIVDFVGDISDLAGNKGNFQILMTDLSAEYIDFINAGLNGKTLEEAGFINKSKTNLVITNYFEPYILENIDLDYAFKSVDNNQEIVFYKADADQDRPNLLFEEAE